MLLDFRPTGGRQDEDGNALARQILLVAQVLIGCHQKLETRFGSVQEFAIGEGRSAQLVGGRNRVRSQGLAQRRRGALIEQDSHEQSRSGNRETFFCMAEHSHDLLAGNAGKPLEEILQKRPILDGSQTRRGQAHGCL